MEWLASGYAVGDGNSGGDAYFGGWRGAVAPVLNAQMKGLV